MSGKENQKSLPVFSFSDIVEKVNSNHSGLFVDLQQSLSSYGFFYLTELPIDSALVARLQHAASEFFALDSEVKDQFHMRNAGKAWRGYFKLGEELTQGTPDYKEGLYFGEEHDPQDPKVLRGVIMHGSNQWPLIGQKSMKQLVTSYMLEMKGIGQVLMTAMAMSLGLESEYFNQRFGLNPTQLFRIFHYPPASSPNNMGVSEHTDMGFLTILLQDDQEGLEVKLPDGQWIPAPPLPGSVVINIGDMMEFWTQGALRATPHRVHNASGINRYSYPYFYDPHWDSLLHPIDPKLLGRPPQDTANIKRWDGLDLLNLNRNMTYGDFVTTKITSVFPQL